MNVCIYIYIYIYPLGTHTLGQYECAGTENIPANSFFESYEFCFFPSSSPPLQAHVPWDNMNRVRAN